MRSGCHAVAGSRPFRGRVTETGREHRSAPECLSFRLRYLIFVELLDGLVLPAGSAASKDGTAASRHEVAVSG
jgi:hypothetical protein